MRVIKLCVILVICACAINLLGDLYVCLRRCVCCRICVGVCFCFMFFEIEVEVKNIKGMRAGDQTWLEQGVKSLSSRNKRRPIVSDTVPETNEHAM